MGRGLVALLGPLGLVVLDLRAAGRAGSGGAGRVGLVLEDEVGG